MRPSRSPSSRAESPAMVVAALRCLLAAVEQMAPDPAVELGVHGPARAWVLIDTPDGSLITLAAAESGTEAPPPDARLSLPVAPEAFMAGGALLIEADHPAHAPWVPWLAELRARTLVVFPLAAHGRFLGLGVLASAAPLAFSDRHERLCQAHAAMLALTLEDARAIAIGAASRYQERSTLWQREMELSALYALTAAAMESTCLEHLLERALGHILSLTHLPAGLLLYHTADHPHPILSQRGLSEAVARAAMDYEATWGLDGLYRCLAGAEPGDAAAALRAMFTSSLSSWVVLPLHHDETLLGLLLLGSADYSQLSDELSKLLSTITNQLLLAIERAQAMAHMEELVALRTAELRESHRQLEDTIAELQRMDQFKTNFLSNVSHELRTPLSGIIGFGEFLAEGVYGDLTSDQQIILDRLVKSSYDLMTLINNLLDLSRIDAGRLKLYREPIDLATLIEQSIGQVESQAMVKDIRLEVPEGEPPTVDVDPGRIVQVLVNLLSNAIKFTPEHGTIAVRYAQMGEEITVAVSDTGIGIPAEHLPMLFLRFSQVDGSHTRQFSGTGLGLAICRELIELHQQRIWVSSTPGQGSTFYFTLPVWQPAVEPVIKKG